MVLGRRRRRKKKEIRKRKKKKKVRKSEKQLRSIKFQPFFLVGGFGLISPLFNFFFNSHNHSFQWIYNWPSLDSLREALIILD